MTEVWRPIPDWEGMYSVSDRGRVRSEPRIVYRPTTASGYTVAGRVLKPNAMGSVNLSRRGDRQSVITHRLAGAIFGNERNKQCLTLNPSTSF